NGCSANAATNIDAAPSLLTLAATPTQPLCFGETGSVASLADGGTGSYTYSGDAVSGLTQGTYNYSVQDANGCIATATASVDAAPSLLELTATPTQPLCFGETGTVALSAQGGTGSYSFGGDPVLNLGEGTYHYTVEDGNGCTANATASVSAAPSLLTLSATPSQPKCFGETGSVVLSASGGTGLYTYSGDNTSGLGSGTYSYTVQDANGCSANAATNIDAAPSLLTLAATPTQPSCYGGTGSVALHANGGTGAYHYSGDATSGLGNGTYQYAVSDDNQCSAVAAATIVVPSAVSGVPSSTPSGCTTYSGTASVTPSGGTPGYTYLWSPGGQTTQSISGLAGGNYSVIITDSHSCTGSANITVGYSGANPATPGVISGPAGACKNQSSVVYSVAAVVGANYYSWTLPIGANGSSASNSITINFDNSFMGGSICVTAINYCGSSAASCISVSQLTAVPSAPVSISGPASMCSPATATFSVAAVANAFSYNWTVSGAGLSIVSGQGTSSISVNASSGFVSGTVSVVASNCIGNSSVVTKTIYGRLTSPPVYYDYDNDNDNLTIGVCGGSTHDYEIMKIPGATSYRWLAPTGCTMNDYHGHSGNPLVIDSAYDEVFIVFPSSFTSGNVSVYATNACGNSPAATLFVQSKTNAPLSITGPQYGVCRTSGNVYSIAAVTGATSYTWTVPSGASITANTGTSITVTYGNSFSSSGSISVKANNSCGSSAAASLTVYAAPAVPAAITGAMSVCKSQASVSYSVAAVTGATSYTWTITGGATFVGSSTGAAVTVKFTSATAASATLTVKANNTCGSSATKSLTIAVNLSCRVTAFSEPEPIVSDVAVYPNPTSGKLFVSFNADSKEKYSIKVIDLIGNVLFTDENVSVEGNNLEELNLSGYAKGIYFIRLEGEGMTTKTIRFTVD
ncbi:MAG: T9SS type A sorting domain-containing protein, partial [Bacteroidetes bacterium]|nr:T9SS type A sorting domain-containing protein [Bacteroidota bacterium]